MAVADPTNGAAGGIEHSVVLWIVTYALVPFLSLVVLGLILAVLIRMGRRSAQLAVVPEYGPDPYDGLFSDPWTG